MLHFHVLICLCIIVFGPDFPFLVMTTTGINLTAMLAVDRCYRPNASAFLMLTSNIAGVLPLPVIMGLIKDKLAPSCRVGPSGEFDDPEQCHAEGAEIRKCLAMAYSWVLWSLAFFEIARQFSWRNAERSGRQEVRRSIRCYWRDQKELQ